MHAARAPLDSLTQASLCCALLCCVTQCAYVTFTRSGCAHAQAPPVETWRQTFSLSLLFRRLLQRPLPRHCHRRQDQTNSAAAEFSAERRSFESLRRRRRRRLLLLAQNSNICFELSTCSQLAIFSKKCSSSTNSYAQHDESCFAAGKLIFLKQALNSPSLT